MRIVALTLLLGLLSLPVLAADGQPALTTHSTAANGTSISYRAEAGTLPIRDAATNESHGEMFYTAYLAADSGEQRPVTFLWNGGPGANSAALHFEAFGPRRLAGDKFEDNDTTLLGVSDLVFVDPIGTGFSRATKPEYEKEFYSTLGDFASVTQFVRTWLAAHHRQSAPIFLVGESFGTWRAASVAEALEKRGQKVAGIVLISGGAVVDRGLIPRNLEIALRVPNRAATALAWGKLDPSVGTDLDQVEKTATAWARDVYAPALLRLDALTSDERNAIAAGLARYTGFPPDQIDRRTLSVTPRQYLRGLLAGKTLNTFDMRKISEAHGNAAAIDAYFRHDLGYDTPLGYAGLDAAVPTDPAMPKSEKINANWDYNSAPLTPEIMASAMAGEGPPGAVPWTTNALKLDPKMKVFVAAGLYDSLNSCAANDELKARLDPAFAGNFTMACYLGGHMMYRDEDARHKLAKDLNAFITSGAPQH
jgi:carboxypeptidase C (cathepsin A)